MCVCLGVPERPFTRELRMVNILTHRIRTQTLLCLCVTQPSLCQPKPLLSCVRRHVSNVCVLLPM